MLANYWHDFDLGGPLTPYLGGGAGFAQVTTQWNLNGTHLAFGSGFGPAAQIGGGIRYALTDKVTFDLGYRLKTVINPVVNVTYLTQSEEQEGVFFGAATHEAGTIFVHSVQAGITVAFN